MSLQAHSLLCALQEIPLNSNGGREFNRGPDVVAVVATKATGESEFRGGYDKG
jgi:hypothetical protein